MIIHRSINISKNLTNFIVEMELYDRWLEKEQIPKDEGHKFQDHYKKTFSFAVFKLQEAIKDYVISSLPKN